jgi:hypothetical protein
LSAGKAEVAVPYTFSEFFASNRPATDVELGEALTKLTAAVNDTGKKGSITVTLNVLPVDDEGHTYGLDDSIKVNIPERPRKKTIAYADKDGRLTRSNPNTMPLFTDDDLRDVADQTGTDLRSGEIKDVDL